jgi:hypothetical protein
MDSFPRAQPHRALCHNFLFLGLIYLVNPFLALGVFLHTFLDAFTTVRDRGVEWLFPFTRLVKSVVYDSDGTRLQLDPAHKIYLLQNPFRRTTRKNQSSCDEQSVGDQESFARSSERTLGAFLEDIPSVCTDDAGTPTTPSSSSESTVHRRRYRAVSTGSAS